MPPEVERARRTASRWPPPRRAVARAPDGAEAWRGDGLTTRTQISHAGSAEFEAGDGARIEVEVPTQGLAAEVEPRPYVVVAVADGGLQVSYPELLGFA